MVVLIGAYTTSIAQTKTTSTTTVTTTTIEDAIPVAEAPEFVIAHDSNVYNSYDYNIVKVTSAAIHLVPMAAPHTLIVLPGTSIQNIYIVETSPVYVSFNVQFGRFWIGYPSIHHYHKWSVYSVTPSYKSNIRQVVRQSHRQNYRQKKRQITRRVDDRPKVPEKNSRKR